MADENINYTFYGDNLDPYNEDEIRKKPVPIEEQIVLDKNGKQRFHGAFTGGFAAGYWNTVGSEEGWTPTLFKSSRSEKAQKREQRPQDFMDDEDQEEFGIAPKVLRARQEFGGVSRDATRVHGDTLGVAKLLQAATERVGERILRKQGWRHGEGIGPKVSQQEKRETRKKNEKEGRKVYGCAMGPIPTERPTTEDSTDSESDTDVTYAPEDLPACLVKPKTNTFGMGYSGLSRNTVLSGHINLFEPNVMNAPRAAVAGIRGQAFGVGAFEAEDEDIYGADDMSRYDFSLESAGERKRKRRWDQETSKKQRVQEDCLGGFQKATKPLATANYYPPPVLPKDFNPKHKAKTSRFSEATVQPNNQHIRQGLGRHDMSAEERSVLLGEAKERIAVTSTLTEPTVAVTEVTEEFHVEPAVLKAGQLNPFTHDASKQLRYRQFLTLAKEGRKEELHKLQPKTMTEWERGRELKEFDTASALFKSGPMDDRFVSSATLLGSDEIPKLEAPKVEATVAAAKMKQFGKLTRTREPWQPCSLLCKRFNVPEPNSGTLVATRRKPGFSVFDFMSAAPLNSHAEQTQEVVEQPDSQAATSATDVPPDLPVENIPLPDTQETTVPEDPNARLDFYKAIFLSSSEDEGEEEPPPPPPPPPPKEAERLRVRELPREEPPPKPRSPPRGVFANLEQVLNTCDIELPPDSYGPSAPTSLPSAPSASARPTVQLAPPGSCWVEKETSARKKKHKKHSKKKHTKEDRHSRSRTKRNRSLSSSSTDYKKNHNKEGHPSIFKNESPSTSRNDKSHTSRSRSPTHDRTVSKSPTRESKSPTVKTRNDRSVSKSLTRESRSPTLKKRYHGSKSKSPTRDTSRSKSPTYKKKHNKSSENSSYKKKHDRSSSKKKHDRSKSPTYRRRSRSPKSSTNKKKHDRSRSKSPKSKHHKKKHSRSSSRNSYRSKSLVKDSSSKKRDRSLSHSKSRSRSPPYKQNATLDESPMHKHSKKKHHKKHKKGKKECKHHRKDKSPEVISISSSDEN